METIDLTQVTEEIAKDTIMQSQTVPAIITAAGDTQHDVQLSRHFFLSDLTRNAKAIITATGDTQHDVQLSRHFFLSDLTRDAKAIRRDIDNTPDVDSVIALQELALHILEPLRQRFGHLRIISAFRCGPLNKAIRASSTSQHLRGEAADLLCVNNIVGRKMFYFIINHLDFDQLLVETRGERLHALHVSYRADAPNRHRVTSYHRINVKEKTMSSQ